MAVDLRREGAILLVSCYELGHPPLGLAWPAAFLERAGFRPALHDLAAAKLAEAPIDSAEVVAISVPMHTALRLGVKVAERVRALRPDAHIVFFGHYAVLNARTLLGSLADSVLGGEHEGALVALCQALERAEPPLRALRVAGGVQKVKLPFLVPSRSQLPPLERYARLDTGDRLLTAGAVEASRGCKHHCTHCPLPPVYGGHFYVVPLETVRADVEALLAAGARHISFADPDFLNGPRHALQVARAVHALDPALSFDFTAKIEHLLAQADLLPELGQLGALFVVSAVESLSQRVLSILDKGHQRADVLAAQDALDRAGIALRPTLLPFTPWAGIEDYLELLEWIAERDLIGNVDPVQLSVRLLVPPGSLLEAHPEMLPHRGPLEADRFAYRWDHPDPRMDALQRAVVRLVERESEADPLQTFGRICALTAEIAAEGHLRARAAGAAEQSRHRSRELAVKAQRAPRVPRLTEPWFC